MRSRQLRASRSNRPGLPPLWCRWEVWRERTRFQLVWCGGGEFVVEPKQPLGLIEGKGEDTAGDGADLMQTEVASTSAQRPEEVGIFRRARFEKASVGGHHVRGNEVVASGYQSQSNFFIRISSAAVARTMSPIAISVPCGEWIQGRSSWFMPKKLEMAIAGRAMVPSTVSTFIT